MKYTDKLRDPRWQQKKAMICQRDSWRCRDCGDGTKILHVHHHRYGREPWDIEDKFLRTLCEDCHAERQQFEDAAKLALALIVSQSSLAEVKELADRLSGMAIEPEIGRDWLIAERWISYATEYPAHRAFVEMVLGRSIEWQNAGKASA